MRKEILYSVLITVLLLTGVYFVVSSGIKEGNGLTDTFYNVSSSGNINLTWNKYTNYTYGNGSAGGLIPDTHSLYFNFTIRNNDTVFSGNISNITINFSSMFQVDLNSWKGNITPCLGGTPSFEQNASTDLYSLVFYNKTNTTAGLTNGSGDSGNVAYSNCTFQLNASINGTGIKGVNGSSEITGPIVITVRNGSGSSDTLTFTVGIDSQAPRITNINVTVGSVTQLVGANTPKIIIQNTSNITIMATITDANIWRNNTANKNTGGNKDGNFTIWWNASGSGPVKIGNANTNSTNMTNLSSCTWAEGANGCTFYAVLPQLGNQQIEFGNMSFVITASDYFEHASNASLVGGVVGYNITFDNSASDCEITLPSEMYIIYREIPVTCSGDSNATRLYESDSGVEVCNGIGGCEGTYIPQESGTRTLECVTTDAAGNSKLCSTTLSINSRASIYAGEAAAPSGTTPTPSALDVSKEAGTTGLTAGESTTFKYGTIDHTIKIDSLTSDSVTLTVDTISATIGSGESKEFDLNADGTNDVKVTLNKILLNKADISVEKLAGASTEAPTPVTQAQGTSLTWLWIVLILIVVAIIVYLLVSARKNK